MDRCGLKMTNFVFVLLISAIHVWEQGSTKRENILIAEQSSKAFINKKGNFLFVQASPIIY